MTVEKKKGKGGMDMFVELAGQRGIAFMAAHPPTHASWDSIEFVVSVKTGSGRVRTAPSS